MFLTSITLICLGAAIEEPPVPQAAELGAERLGMAEQEAQRRGPRARETERRNRFEDRERQRRFDGTQPQRLGLGQLPAFAVNDRGDLLIIEMHPVRRADGTIVVYPVGQVYAAGAPGWVPYGFRGFERQDDAGWHDYAERPDDAGHQDDQHWKAEQDESMLRDASRTGFVTRVLGEQDATLDGDASRADDATRHDDDATLVGDDSLADDRSMLEDLSYEPIIVHPPLEPDQTLDAWVVVDGEAFLLFVQARDATVDAQQGAGGMQGAGAEPKTRIVDYYHGLDPLQEQQPQSQPGVVIFYPAGDAFAVLARNAGLRSAGATRR